MNESLIEKLDWEKSAGLVPAIVQDASTAQVLMLGFMNPEALDTTLSSGFVCFFSRTRNCLWTKGETSGNKLRLVSIAADCDNDTLLVQAQPMGPVCHTNAPACFDTTVPASSGFLDELEDVIKNRQAHGTANSYTNTLLGEGTPRIAQKVGEEAIETVIAATAGDPEALCLESADLLYHLLVLLRSCDLSLSDVITELKHRHSKN